MHDYDIPTRFPKTGRRSRWAHWLAAVHSTRRWRRPPGQAGMLNANGQTATSPPCARCASGAAACWPRSKTAAWSNWKAIPTIRTPRASCAHAANPGLMTTYDPDRVLTPLIRVGKRGEGKFRKASWEEALDLVARTCWRSRTNTARRRWSSPPPTTCSQPSSRTCCTPSARPTTAPSAACASTP